MEKKVFWFFSRLKKKLHIIKVDYPHEIDHIAVTQLNDWINMSLVFHSNAMSNIRKKSRNPITSTHTPIYCDKCKDKYYIRNLSRYQFKKMINKSGHFTNCIQHADLDRNIKQTKKSEEYIDKVNKLYKEGYSKSYRDIMLYLDSESKDVTDKSTI